MPRYKGPKATVGLYWEKSRFPISDERKERNLLLHYHFWPRRTGKSLFEQQHLGETWEERPLSAHSIRCRKRHRQSNRESRAQKLRRLRARMPIDGRESLSGPRKINLSEFVPTDLARHIKASGDARDLARGRELHAYVLASDFRDSRYLANTLVEMYAKCERIDDAIAIFREIKVPNVFSFNIMIAALVHNARVAAAIDLFAGMRCRDMVTWNTMVTAYAQTRQPDVAWSVFQRMPYRGVVSWTAIVASYAENGRLDEARELFAAMPERTVVSWNAMLQALAEAGDMDSLRDLFAAMPERDVISWTSMITAHGSSRRLDSARVFFDRMPNRDTASWNAMIEAYALNRQPFEARRLFDRMPCPDDLSWPALIRAYAICGHILEAKIIYDKCPRQTSYTRAAIVASYAQNGDLAAAAAIFEEMPHKNWRAWNAMIAGYAGKGDFLQAEGVLSRMPLPNSMSWNAIVHGYARSGRHSDAIAAATRMNLAGVASDDVTFLGLLNSCNHTGLIELSRELFLAIRDHHFAEPTVNHYCCMINALGRAGRLGQAHELVATMPFLPDAVVWTTLLTACKLHGDAELGTFAAKHAFELDPCCSSPYLLLVDLETQPQRSEDWRIVPQAGFQPTTKKMAAYFGTGRVAETFRAKRRVEQRRWDEHDVKRRRMLYLREVLRGCGENPDPSTIQRLQTLRGLRDAHRSS